MKQRTNRTTTSRRRAVKHGHGAETFAALYLRLKGYRVLARRYRCHAGEIDLIARRGRHLVFVEVKARKTRAAALEAVRPAQRRRIIRAASQWLANQSEIGRLPEDYSASFDLLIVCPRAWPLHLKSAFDATM